MSTIVLKNIPHDTIPSEVAEYLWATVGIGVNEENIKLAMNGSVSGMAFVTITAANLIEFLKRNLSDKEFGGRTLVFENLLPPKKTGHRART